MRVCVEVHWQEPPRPVTRDAAGRLLFPPVLARPGIYRLELRHGDDSAFYVGEAKNLRRRMGNYRRPGLTQRTSQRVHRLLQACIARGGRVELVTVRQAQLEVDGQPIPADLAAKACRLLVENAVLVVLQNAGASVHNL
jgi:hypothetical protein